MSGFPTADRSLLPGEVMTFRVRVQARPRANRVVQLQQRVGGDSCWSTLLTRVTGARGVAVLALPAGREGGSALVRVKVKRHRSSPGAVTRRARYTVRAEPTSDSTPASAPTPAPAPAPDGADSRAARVLALVNEARAVARTCGGESFPAVGSLAAQPQLKSAAAKHAQEMVSANFFSHTSPDGRGVVQRVKAEGYGWSRLGEKIAAGQPTARAVVDDWLASAGHCRNIMGAYYTELGVGVAEGPDSDYGIYWIQNFATPR